MTTKLSISVTDAQAKQIDKAVKSGQYASASEYVRSAMRRMSFDEQLGALWDEGVASGRADPQLTMAEIKAKAKRQLKRRSK